ncbi:single-stranded nucleic acid binding R3H domain-containing protein [Deinococcus proteolyticus MRP]|uniref:Single-stranded nucleic acid binding R3H domain-containing protein n=1 Tax=Deinococcus proteolyticus (strain ATCC 35074 / DSM 20540 / JCM 6276 / NBRC 101906 / NCIMB 13154 / VKM Ac-1939 / CCM 2703 / MRP) TaxID=693977 RepID=F0RJD8_DEIPM|nr:MULTISPECIES: R3H domain-containing nucleic acid-binding protein [Deinococcus]ADY25479.1 single-stranded nucleic acid binding R3H domain-containing protein [Deinococcus proteolyticus MRP]MCY1701598.1 KH domain-containing protein [Deinococcus sp. SL84]
MHDPKDLDDYLAGLGISDADDDTSSPNLLAAAPAAAPAPSFGALSSAPSPGHLPAAQDPQTVLEHFLRGVARRFDPGLTVRVTRDGDHLSGEISGENVGRLIGREGHVIEALDTLAYAVVAKHVQGGEHLRVRIDVGGYRSRHFQMLQQIAGRVAAAVASSGESHTFQPMNPADRRIIHMTLKDNPHVVTQSVGEGNGRRLVVKPAPAR